MQGGAVSKSVQSVRPSDQKLQAVFHHWSGAIPPARQGQLAGRKRGIHRTQQTGAGKQNARKNGNP